MVMGNPLHQKLFEELLEVRQGVRGRPRGNAPIYWNLREFARIPRDESVPRAPLLSLIVAAKATPEEVALFAEAEDASNGLAIREHETMQLKDDAGHTATVGDLTQLFDENFRQGKARVMVPIERFGSVVDARTLKAMAEAVHSTAILDRIIAAATLALLGAIALTWRGFRTLIGEPTADFFERIRSLLPAGRDASPRQGTPVNSLSLAIQSVATELGERDNRIADLISTLLSAETRMRLLVENAPVALALFDTQMRNVAWSKRWETDYRIEGRVMLGHSHYETFPDLPDVWREAHRRGLAGESLSSAEDRFERDDGSEQFISWGVTPWHDATGAVGGIIIMTIDVTEIVVNRANLSGWKKAFASARVGLAISDSNVPDETRIVEVNPHLAHLLGRTHAELHGALVMPLIAEGWQDSMRAIVPELDATGHVSFESMLLAADGRKLPILMDISAQPVTTGGSQRRIIFVVELAERYRLLREVEDSIAELKATNLRLRQTTDDAIAATSTRNVILANMSHELRTPLSHVLGFAHLLESMPLEAKAMDRVQRITLAGGALLRLVNMLLDAVRIETGTLLIKDQDFRLEDVLATLNRDLLPQLRKAGRQVNTSLEPDLPALLIGDPARIGQALRELIDNALKFSAQGPVSVRAEKRLTASGDTRLRLEVEDHGAGVPPEQEHALFSWFMQGDSSATRSVGGIGMGLVVAQRITFLMEGSMGYRTNPGGGSTFWMDLPLREGRPRESSSAQTDPAEARAWLAQWLTALRAHDLVCISQWNARLPGVDTLLGASAGLLDTAVMNFDLDIAGDLVEEILTVTPETERVQKS